MQVSRLLGFAAVLLSGVCAGTIDSKNGNAIVTPAPRRKVRRERCFLVINMVALLLHLHLKRCALHDTEHERRKTIIIASRVANDRPDDRHVVVMYRAAKRIG